MIPAWLIALMALLYAGEYVFRFVKYRNYIHLGKAIGRFVLFGVYLYISLYNPAEYTKQVWVRLSLFLLLFVDLLYIAQEHLTRTKIK